MLKKADRLRFQAYLAHSVHLREVRGKLAEKKIYVSTTVSERRNADLCGRKAEVKVFAEFSTLHSLIKMHVGGGDNPYIGMLNLV